MQWTSKLLEEISDPKFYEHRRICLAWGVPLPYCLFLVHTWWCSGIIPDSVLLFMLRNQMVYWRLNLVWPHSRFGLITCYTNSAAPSTLFQKVRRGSSNLGSHFGAMSVMWSALLVENPLPLAVPSIMWLSLPQTKIFLHESMSIK